MMLKVGIIGCGLMGTVHARTLNSFPDVKITAVYNRTREKAETLAQETGATVYDTYEHLLEQDLDAVWVSTPDHLHVDVSIAVMESGKHLFLEKALATSVEDGRKIVDAQKKYPHIKAMVGYPLRFAPAYRTMKKILSGNDVGKTIQAWSMRTHFLDPNSKVYDKYRDHFYETPSWYFTKEAKGPIYSHGSHDYDLLMWYGGEVESVFAYGGSYLLPTDNIADAFTVAMRFKNGGIAQVSTPWVTRVEYDITGVATENLTVVNNNGEVMLKDKTNPQETIQFADNNMWDALNRHFVDCILGHHEPLIPLEDGLKVIAVSDAAYRSLNERKEVFVES